MSQTKAELVNGLSINAAAADSLTIDSNGNIQISDNAKIQIGTGNDLELFHDGTNSWIKDVGTNRLIIDTDGQGIDLTKSGASEYLLRTAIDGAVELYHNGTKKLETASFGLRANDSIYCDEHIVIDNDTGIIKLGTGADLQIFHDGNNSFIKDAGTGRLSIVTSELQLTNAADSEVMIKATENGAVLLYYDGTHKLETSSGGAQIVNGTGNAQLNIRGGSSDGTAVIQFIADDNADNGDNFRLIGNSSSSLFEIQDYAAGSWVSKIQIQGGASGAVFLSYGNSQKLYTSQYGVNVTGIHEVQGNVASNYVNHSFNDGNSNTRYGSFIKCGTDDASGTNYALGVSDGDGGTQGYLTFTGGTLSLVAFTAAHPCIIPDADNPSDDSMAYPYGTLLETISIEYSQKNGADTERGIRYKVQKTQSANSKKVLGAYAGSMNGGPDGQTNEHDAYVLGDGHILVNNAGGNIEVGDGICSSATAGIGQKATANPSMIIGIAQEAVTFTGTETKLVAVQYGLQQFTPWS